MIRVYAQEEIAKRRKHLWTEAISLVKEIGGDAGKALLVEAYHLQQRAVVTSIEESLAWLVSPEGDRFHFSESIKKFQPALTSEKVSEIYDLATATQLNTFREFQYLAYNPDGAESAMKSAVYLKNHSYEIPDEIVEHVEVLIEAVLRTS